MAFIGKREMGILCIFRVCIIGFKSRIVTGLLVSRSLVCPRKFAGVYGILVLWKLRIEFCWQDGPM